jgi:hypothetical protein
VQVTEFFLPPGNSFPVHLLASALHVSRNHLIKLIDTGEIKCAVDLRSPGSSCSTIRVPRAAVLEFLESRKIVVVPAEKNGRR